jgi:hypothetical protein
MNVFYRIETQKKPSKKCYRTNLPDRAHNDPAFKRRGDYDLFEVAKLIPGNQVSIAPRPRPIKTPC